MPELPSGTVTFLFTDVEGSTRLWEEHPAAMRAALVQHDAIVEFLTEQHRGQVVRPRGEGDSRFCVFARATDAVRAAAAIQAALHAERWPTPGPVRVRMALHTGEADLREGDYYGSAVNRCARLRAIAHGGQVLLSRATADLTHEGLRGELALRDLGEHRLRDLSAPERVHELTDRRRPDDFPPLRSLDALPNNLPLQVTSFVGRERELDEVKRLLGAARLLTLTGTGGAGKTRLALQVAADLVEAFADGVWLVDLAPVFDPELVATTALAALGVGGAPGQRPDAALVEHLRRRQVLLVLDNCEHLLESCARVASVLIRGCPGVRVVVTSREMLGVAGETAWRVPSLGLPDPDARPTAAELEACEAVRLFIDRARAVEPSFAVSDQNAPALAQVCRRLDGIPLALELAAARVRVLTVEQIAARLHDRFRLLTGGGRTALRRQQTLQALVDWSHDLLDDAEKALFRRLAVFAGGWTLEAAEAVAQGAPIAASDVLDRLTSLVDKSLVVADASGAAERYTFLETLRQYAEDKLLQAGEAAAVRDRHCDWCVMLGRVLGRAAERELWPMTAELDNLRAALTWCASGDPAGGMALIAGVGYRWGIVGGGQAEARRWLETFLALVPEPTASRAEALLALGHHLRWLHEFALAGPASEEALAIYRQLGDEEGIALATAAVGLVAANQGDYARAWRHLDEALASARRRDDVAATATFLRDVGVTCTAAGELARARVALTESATLVQRDSTYHWLAQLRLGIIDRLEGDHARARERLAAIGRAFGRIPAWADLVRLEEANQARAAGRVDEGRAGILDVLRRGRQRVDFPPLQDTLAMLGMCEIAAGAHARGVALLAAASMGEGPIGTVHMPDVRFEAPIHLRTARAALGEAGYAAAWAEGRATTLEQAVADALERAGVGREVAGAGLAGTTDAQPV